ncbi:MAG: hypothetical protein RBT16_14130 [Desulfococcus multivorans]|jgi:hypothetical protein|nr:hypothetical protein [Desulfococcus multivorans]
MEREAAFDFSHPELNAPVRAIGGSYYLLKECRLTVDGEEILYLVGVAVIDTSCCGVGGCAYALVPGAVRDWHYKTGEDGRPMSRVRPVSDETARKKIRAMIIQKEPVHQVDFL